MNILLLPYCSATRTKMECLFIYFFPLVFLLFNQPQEECCYSRLKDLFLETERQSRQKRIFSFNMLNHFDFASRFVDMTCFLFINGLVGDTFFSFPIPIATGRLLQIVPPRWTLSLFRLSLIETSIQAKRACSLTWNFFSHPSLPPSSSWSFCFISTARPKASNGRKG